jgi:hypothetical protein
MESEIVFRTVGLPEQFKERLRMLQGVNQIEIRVMAFYKAYFYPLAVRAYKVILPLLRLLQVAPSE